jgi:hypothetical protein
MYEYFVSNFGDKGTGCCIMTTHRLKHRFSPGNFLPKRCPPPTLLFSVSKIECKLEGRHFDTIEVIEAESQAVLNTLKEHRLPECIYKMAEALGAVHAH